MIEGKSGVSGRAAGRRNSAAILRMFRFKRPKDIGVKIILKSVETIYACLFFLKITKSCIVPLWTITFQNFTNFTFDCHIAARKYGFWKSNDGSIDEVFASTF